MKIRRPRAPHNLGSISHGTTRQEDLLPTFLSTLDSQRPRQRSDRKLISGIRRRMRRRNYFGSEDAGTDLENLFDCLEHYAPPYFYFGAHSGDGTDYGFWLREDWEEAFDGLKVSDLAAVPKDYSGEVVHINDHGNMSLYRKGRNGQLREIWAIV